MPLTLRPRRSVLYMPGSNSRALDKARGLAADGLIFDLEDAVSPDAKSIARDQVMAALAQGGYGRREILVRVNGLATPWGRDDLLAAARSAADGVILPKVESAGQLREAEAICRLPLWCMIETPLGVLRAEEICAGSDNLVGLIMGTSDLAKDLHACHTAMRLPLLVPLGHCLLAARAFGLAILDGVHLDLDDLAGFEQSCLQGVELGFDGKTLIHPKTIEIANRIFAPSDSELAWSRRVIDGFQSGVAVIDGRLVEQLHVDNAKRIVALAEQIAAMGN